MSYSLLKHTSVSSLYQVGKGYCVLGRYQDAVNVLKEVVKRKQGFADAHFFLGVAYHELAEKSLAMNEWQVLKELNQEMANELYSKYLDESESKRSILEGKKEINQNKQNDKDREIKNKNLKKPSMFVFDTPTFQKLVRSKIAWGVLIYIVIVVWSSLASNNNTQNFSSEKPNSSSQTSSGNINGTGQYRCSTYHLGKAQALEPGLNVKAQLDIESADLTRASSNLKSLESKIKGMHVDKNSQTSLVNYNQMVDSYNARLRSLKSRAANFDRKNKLFNGQVDAHNKYLDDNCTGAR